MCIERIIGNLRNVRGYTYDVIYDLVFTSERVIAVIIKHPEDVQTYQFPSLNSLLVGNWISRRKEQSEQIKLGNERRQAIAQSNLDELL